MNPVIQEVEASQLKQDIPFFRPGDTVRVMVRIVEGNKERVQPFEGVVIRRKGSGIRETFTVRRVSFNVGMERIFPLHSPRIESIKVLTRSKVRRAKLYYLRSRRGKSARLEERRIGADKLAREASVKQTKIENQIALAKASESATASQAPSEEPSSQGAE